MGKLQENSKKYIKMAQPFNSLDNSTRDQMACTFAALMLHDEGVEVTNANLKKVTDASGINVAAYWPMLFANAPAGRSVGDFLAVSGGSAPVQTAQDTNTGAGPAKAEEKKEEKVEEEEDEDFALDDLFG